MRWTLSAQKSTDRNEDMSRFGLVNLASLSMIIRLHDRGTGRKMCCVRSTSEYLEDKVQKKLSQYLYSCSDFEYLNCCETGRTCSINAATRTCKLEEVIYSSRTECAATTWDVVGADLLALVHFTVVVSSLTIVGTNAL